jgi:hypothetical protein
MSLISKLLTLGLRVVKGSGDNFSIHFYAAGSLDAKHVAGLRHVYWNIGQTNRFAKGGRVITGGDTSHHLLSVQNKMAL